MSRNHDQNLFMECLIGIGLIAFLVYMLVKTFADWLNLDWHSAAMLLSGLLISAGAILGVALQGWNLKKWVPWIGCGFFLSTIPSLNWWARLDSMPFHMDGMGRDFAWYGNGWWQMLVFLVLCLVAYAISQWND